MDHDAALKVAAVALRLALAEAPRPKVTMGGEGDISNAVTGQSSDQVAKVAVEDFSVSPHSASQGKAQHPAALLSRAPAKAHTARIGFPNRSS